MCLVHVRLWAACGHLSYESERCAKYPRCKNPHSNTSTLKRLCEDCWYCQQYGRRHLDVFTFCDPRFPCADGACLCKGWETKRLVDNRGLRLYFVDLNTNQIYFTDPRTIPYVSTTDLPNGWTRSLTPTGRMYYVDHNTKTTTFTHPGSPMLDTTTPLPLGWEMYMNPECRAYFVNNSTHEAAKRAVPRIRWLNGDQIQQALVKKASKRIQGDRNSNGAPFIRMTLQRLNYLLHQYHKFDKQPNIIKRREIDEYRIEFLQRVIFSLNVFFDYEPSDNAATFAFPAEDSGTQEYMIFTNGIVTTIELLLFFPKHDRLNYIFREPQALTILPEEQSTCPLCEENYGPEHQAVQLLPCGHTLCHCCLQAWFHKQNTCPFCRQVYRADEIRRRLKEELSALRPGLGKVGMIKLRGLAVRLLGGE